MESLFSDSRKIVAGAARDFWTQWHKVKCKQTGHVKNEISRSLYQGVTQTLPISAYLWKKSIQGHSSEWDSSFKGTSVIAFTYKLHRNSKVWEKTNEFLPDRFLNGSL